MCFLQRERLLIISHCRFMYQERWIPGCRGERASRKGIAGETVRFQLIGQGGRMALRTLYSTHPDAS